MFIVIKIVIVEIVNDIAPYQNGFWPLIPDLRYTAATAERKHDTNESTIHILLPSFLIKKQTTGSHLNLIVCMFFILSYYKYFYKLITYT